MYLLLPDDPLLIPFLFFSSFPLEGKASFGVDSDGIMAGAPKNLLCRSTNGSVRSPAVISKMGSG